MVESLFFKYFIIYSQNRHYTLNGQAVLVIYAGGISNHYVLTSLRGPLAATFKGAQSVVFGFVACKLNLQDVISLIVTPY